MNEYLIYGFIILFVWFIFIKPLIEFSVWRTWWNDPAFVASDGSPYTCLDMNTIAYFNGSRIAYFLYNAFLPVGKAFASQGEVYFISNLMMSYATNIIPNGRLTPRSLCDTLAHDRYSGGTYPTTAPDWKTLIAAWAGYSGNQQNPYPTGSNWVVTDSDNFLWSDWGIPRDSPLILGFLTNLAKGGNGVEFYPSSIYPLLGLAGQSEGGGWMGYIKGFRGGTEGSLSLNDFERQLWATVANLEIPKWYDPNATPPPVCGTAGWLSSITSGLMSGIFTGASFGGNPIGIVAGIVIGGGTAVGDLLSKKCF